MLAKLYEPIKAKELSTTDRFGIVRDLLALVKSGKLTTSVYLEFLQAYANEDSYIIWSEICGGMGEIYNIAQDNPKLQQQLASYYLKLLQNVITLVGWTPQHNESNSRGLLRALVLGQAGIYGDKMVLKKALALFNQHSKKPVHPDMRGMVYTLAGIKADNKTYNKLFALYQAAHMQEEERRLSRGLVFAENPQMFMKTLKLLFSKHVRGQDAPIMMFLSFLNDKNRNLIWGWIQTNWPEIIKRYDKDHLLLYAIEGLGVYANKKRALEITKFFKNNPAPSAARTIKQVLEEINLKAAWIGRDSKDIAAFLKRVA